MKIMSRKFCFAALVIAMSHPAAAQNATQESTLEVLVPLKDLQSIRSSIADSPATVGGGEADASMGSMMMGGEGMAPSSRQLLLQQVNQIRQLLNAPDQDRKELEPLLREVLAEYFVLDMEERVREFDKIKARVTQMETKLQTRLDRRYEVVELQVKQMLHKADGLDFIVPEQASGQGGYGMESGMDGMMMGDDGGGEMGGSMGMPGGGMSGRGMGMPGMGAEGMGGPAAGGGMGYAEANPVPGYDIKFAMTRFLRFSGKPLKPNDPLRTYRELGAVPGVATPKLRTDSKDEDKLKSLLLAMHHFESMFKHFPGPATRRTRSEKPHSWRVALLPILGHTELYMQYRFDEEWDSENNLKLVEKMPVIFCAKDDPNPENGKTPFQMLVGNGAAFDINRPTQLRDVTDGTSNTIALVMASTSVIWTKPEDVQFEPNAMLAKIAPSRLIGMCDGVVRKVPRWGELQFTIFATRAGGEIATE
jgi:hypothetical protein